MVNKGQIDYDIIFQILHLLDIFQRKAGVKQLQFIIQSMSKK